MKRSKPAALAALSLGAVLAAAPACATEFELSGFGSIVAGRSFGACTPDNALASAFNASCTRFVVDWSHGGVYTDNVSFRPESRVGVQGTARVNPQLSATVQVVGRLVDAPFAQVEWAYLTWSPTPEWTFQAGRKRVPLFFYSDFQDVGYAYPWIRVPPDVYGWDVVNYNGANATWSKTLGGWSLRSSVFGGAETSRRNGYSRIFYDEPKDVKWPRIAGADLEFARDWFTGRVVYMRSGYEQVDRNTGVPDVQPSGATSGRHKAYGGSVNIDLGNFLARSEYSVFDRSRYAYKAKSWFVSAGWRFGNLTPMLTVSDYSETTRFPDAYAISRWSSVGASVRYDFGRSSAFKVQVDRLRDRGATPFMGSATLLSASYDFVF
jgi:hypothetical protein